MTAASSPEGSSLESDQALQTALDGDGSLLLTLSDLYESRENDGTYSDNSAEAILAINCLDDPYAIPASEVPRVLRVPPVSPGQAAKAGRVPRNFPPER